MQACDDAAETRAGIAEKMRVLFHSYNTLGAGPAHVTKFIMTFLARKKHGVETVVIIPDISLFSDCTSTAGARVLRLPVFGGIGYYLFRLAYDVILLPLLSVVLNASTVIVLANYAPMPLKGKKIVFMRHPFLIDDRNEPRTGAKDWIIGKLRKIIFQITLLSTDAVVVQSHDIKERLLRQYAWMPASVHVLPNPVSNLFHGGSRSPEADPFSCDRAVLYVSRYYPHKQHNFLVQLVHRRQEEFRKQRIRFFITIDPAVSGQDATRLLDDIRFKKIDDIIANLGELPHADLADYYRSARCLFFPSAAETFGNPLIEAMAFGLPIIVPDLAYARSVCEDAGLYYVDGDLDDAYAKLSLLMGDPGVHAAFSEKSKDRLSAFPTTDQWVRRVMEIAA
jgi:glycosyltransferase involved in cell wall biosynthesis